MYLDPMRPYELTKMPVTVLDFPELKTMLPPKASKDKDRSLDNESVNEKLFKVATERFEKDFIADARNSNPTAAAKEIGMSRSSF